MEWARRFPDIGMPQPMKPFLLSWETSLSKGKALVPERSLSGRQGRRMAVIVPYLVAPS